tara:strand:- start:10 stop:228 length:219 start_codon:yes stop_codon:yes gene_type:complete
MECHILLTMPLFLHLVDVSVDGMFSYMFSESKNEILKRVHKGKENDMQIKKDIPSNEVRMRVWMRMRVIMRE